MEELEKTIEKVDPITGEVTTETIKVVTPPKEPAKIPSTALEASTMDLVPDQGILNGLEIELEVQNILSLTSALPNLEKIK